MHWWMKLRSEQLMLLRKTSHSHWSERIYDLKAALIKRLTLSTALDCGAWTPVNMWRTPHFERKTEKSRLSSSIVTHNCFRHTKARKDFVLYLTITLVVNLMADQGRHWLRFGVTTRVQTISNNSLAKCQTNLEMLHDYLKIRYQNFFRSAEYSFDWKASDARSTSGWSSKFSAVT